jgi:predicted small secreted protein
MKIFVDLHHFDLYYSLQLLAKRLGWELYRPIGLEWKTEGYWNIGNDSEFTECMLSTQDGRCNEILSQYKTLEGKNWAVFSLHLPRIGSITSNGDGLYDVEDKSKDVYQQGITLEAFKNTKFDVIISSLPQHFPLFEKLRERYQPQAKHIFHHAAIGWQMPDGVKNVMVNSIPTQPLNDLHCISYKQEFDLQIFKKHPPTVLNQVHSYVHYPQTESFWKELDIANVSNNSAWNLKFIGKTLGPLDEIVIRSVDLASAIRNSAWTLHIKLGGESYGHVLHNSFAISRPVIINGDDFKDTSAGELLTDKTCIDISRCSIHEIQKKLIKASHYDEYYNMCINVMQRFKEVVNFDEDADRVRKFMENLQ